MLISSRSSASSIMSSSSDASLEWTALRLSSDTASLVIAMSSTFCDVLSPCPLVLLAGVWASGDDTIDGR